MKHCRSNHRGVALIAVLWLVAAMSLIVTGIVQAVRAEIRSAGLQRYVVVANALADAAILKAMQNLHAQKKDVGSVLQILSVVVEGRSYDVSVSALNGYIDLNRASVALLAEMYRHGGGLDPATAQTLAQATQDLRHHTSAKGVPQRFDAVEDLLRVPGMTYDLYVKIVPLITSDLREGSGRVNPHVAPVGVLQVLTSGDKARAAVLAAGRDPDLKLMDTTFFKPEFIEIGSSRSVQFQVQIDLPDGDRIQKIWLVYWGPDPRSGLPWRVLSTQQSIQHSLKRDN